MPDVVNAEGRAVRVRKKIPQLLARSFITVVISYLIVSFIVYELF